MNYCITSLLLLGTGLLSAADVQVTPVDLNSNSNFPTVPFLSTHDDISISQPTFTIDENGIQAEGRFAVTTKALHLHLQITDPQHDPRGNTRAMWRGDSVQIGIDALGDGADEAVPPDYSIWDDQIDRNNAAIKKIEGTKYRWKSKKLLQANEKHEKSKIKAATPEGRGNVLNFNDGKYTIALNKNGQSIVFCNKHGQAGTAGTSTTVIADISRDDINQRTTYKLTFPWTEFGLPAHFSSTFKCSIQINNTTENEPGKTEAFWGINKFGLGANFKPWFFHRLQTTPPTQTGLALAQTAVYHADDHAEVLLAQATTGPCSVTINGTTHTVKLSDAPLQRIRIGKLATDKIQHRAAVHLTDNAHTFTIRNEATDNWWTWNPQNAITPSVIGMEKWLDAPAGKHGRLQFTKNIFTFEKQEKPVKLWGVNLSNMSAAPEKEKADFIASHFAKYGVNIVRLHKFHGSKGSSGIGDKEDVTAFNPEKLDRFDYFCSKLKEKGIYVLFDPFFAFKVLPANKNDVLSYEEAVKNGKTGLVNIAPDIQDLMIQKMVNLLDHTNPYTQTRYADDPMVAIVEMHNEDDIFWGNTMTVMHNSPIYRKQFAEFFVDWLIKKHGNIAGIQAAWGEGSLNCFPEHLRDGSVESFEKRYVVPICNPWYLSITNMASMQEEKNVTKRLLDTAAFLYEFQQGFYSRYAQAIRNTGYTGVLEASCWQAGSNLPHYLNMHTDYQVGVIDRHNYYGGTGVFFLRSGDFQNEAEFTRPGTGILSSGVQQVVDRPFILSEWDANTPYQWRAAATATIAFYGMGLQGWDGSMQFTAGNSGFTPAVQTGSNNIFNIEVPSAIGMYPALARAIYRNDIREGAVISTRKIHIPSLLNGQMDFNESVEQQGDVKVFTGDLPNEALGLGRTVIEFTEENETSSFPDMTNMLADKRILSQTGEMLWDYAKRDESHFTINTPGTKAFVGFPPQRSIELGDVQITVHNRYATIILTSLEQDTQIHNASHLLLTCMARSRNSGMQYNASETTLEKTGAAPIIMEPVLADIVIPDAQHITVLDHDGQQTGAVRKIVNNTIHINGIHDKTMYYLITK